MAAPSSSEAIRAGPFWPSRLRRAPEESGTGRVFGGGRLDRQELLEERYDSPMTLALTEEPMTELPEYAHEAVRVVQELAAPALKTSSMPSEPVNDIETPRAQYLESRRFR